MAFGFGPYVCVLCECFVFIAGSFLTKLSAKVRTKVRVPRWDEYEPWAPFRPPACRGVARKTPHLVDGKGRLSSRLLMSRGVILECTPSGMLPLSPQCTQISREDFKSLVVPYENPWSSPSPMWRTLTRSPSQPQVPWRSRLNGLSGLHLFQLALQRREPRSGAAARCCGAAASSMAPCLSGPPGLP